MSPIQRILWMITHLPHFLKSLQSSLLITPSLLSPITLTVGEEQLLQFSLSLGWAVGWQHPARGCWVTGSMEWDGRRAQGASSTLVQHQSKAWQPRRGICRKIWAAEDKNGHFCRLHLPCPAKPPATRTHRPACGSTLRSQSQPGFLLGCFRVLCVHRRGPRGAPGSAAIERRMPRCGSVPERCCNTWAPGFI